MPDACRGRQSWALLWGAAAESVGSATGVADALQAARTLAQSAKQRAMSAIWQTETPWCSVIIRNAFGVAGAAHKNGGRFCTRYAWPSGRWGSLPLEGGIEAAYRADSAGADDPEAKMAEIEDKELARLDTLNKFESYIYEAKNLASGYSSK